MKPKMNTNQLRSEGLFPAELHAKMAIDCELTAAKLAAEINSTSCPIRRARLEIKQAQRVRNSVFHRALAERATSTLGREQTGS